MKHPLTTSLLLSALILLAACGGGGSGQSSAPGKAGTKTEAKAAKGKMEAISPDDPTIREEKSPFLPGMTFLTATKLVSGFEIGKPQGSTISNANIFTGDEELSKTLSSYDIRFVCGESDLSPAAFDAYVQALWDNCKAVATDAKLYKDQAMQKNCSSLKQAKITPAKGEPGKLPYRYQWYYSLDGKVREMRIKPESFYNDEKVKVMNHIYCWGKIIHE